MAQAAAHSLSMPASTVLTQAYLTLEKLEKGDIPLPTTDRKTIQLIGTLISSTLAQNSGDDREWVAVDPTSSPLIEIYEELENFLPGLDITQQEIHSALIRIQQIAQRLLDKGAPAPAAAQADFPYSSAQLSAQPAFHTSVARAAAPALSLEMSPQSVPRFALRESAEKKENPSADSLLLASRPASAASVSSASPQPFPQLARRFVPDVAERKEGQSYSRPVFSPSGSSGTPQPVRRSAAYDAAQDSPVKGPDILRQVIRLERKGFMEEKKKALRLLGDLSNLDPAAYDALLVHAAEKYKSKTGQAFSGDLNTDKGKQAFLKELEAPLRIEACQATLDALKGSAKQ